MHRQGPALVGKRLKRTEDKRFLQGRSRFVDDLHLPGLLHMAFVHSPLPHARITSIDVTQPKEDPRLVAVLTAADLPPIPPIPCWDAEPETLPSNQPMLATDVVRFVGDLVAIVVAEDRYAAEDLAQTVRVEYEPLPLVDTVQSALDGGAPVLHADWGTNVFNTFQIVQGQAHDVVARAPRRLEETFRVQRHSAAPMEGRGAVAIWDERDERLSLWTSTQVPHTVRGRVADLVGLPEDALRVVAPDVGGGFGQKCIVYREEVLAAAVAKLLGRPVKWTEDRWENFLTGSHAREQVHQVQVGFTEEGVILGIVDESLTDNGAYESMLALVDAYHGSVSMRGPYRIPHFHATARSVVTNKSPTCPYRGVGMSQAAFVMERVIDSVADELGMDPADVRRRNLIRPEELPVDRGTEHFPDGRALLDTGDYPRCLERALELVGYEEMRARQQELREKGEHIGIGISCYVEQTGMPTFESATIRVEPSGRVVVLSGASSHGQGHATSFAQICADELGADFDDVVIVQGDTDVVLQGKGTFASRSAVVGGTAVVLAAEQMRDKIIRVAASLLETDPSDLEIERGAVRVKGSPDREVTFAEAAQAVAPGRSLPPGVEEYELSATEFFHPENSTFGNGTHVAVVRVDIDTGNVEVLRYVAVSDAGTLINPMIVDGQIHGGVAQGFGSAFLEEILYSDDGQPTNPNLMEYLLPTAEAFPSIVVEHIETPSELNPRGFKGVGEGAVIGSLPAFVGAVADAVRPLGVRITETPITPTRLFELVQKASAATPALDGRGR
jgi:carbon-monoxide dehydrogenase large subunit